MPALRQDMSEGSYSQRPQHLLLLCNEDDAISCDHAMEHASIPKFDIGKCESTKVCTESLLKIVKERLITSIQH